MDTEKVSCPEGKQKPKKQMNKIWEDRAVTPLRKTETDWEWLDFFHSCFGTDFRQQCFGGWTRQNHRLLGLLTAVNSIHASSAQVFLSLSSVFPVWAYRVEINHWPFLHVAAHVARQSKSRSQTILSLRNAQNVSYHTICLMSSGAKKHIRDNKICQCTVAQIYRVTPECSARESCNNIGLFSLSLRLVHLPDRRYIRDCCPYWNPLVTLMTRGFAGVRACCFDN